MTTTRPPRDCSAPRAPASVSVCTPAAQITVDVVDALAAHEHERVLLDRRDRLAEPDVHAALAKRLQGVLLRLRVERRQHDVEPLDEDDARGVVAQRREVLAEDADAHLEEPSGHLDAGRASTDDDERQQTALDQLGMCVGQFDAAKDVIAQSCRVRQRVQRERMLLGARHVEVRGACPAADDQVVVGERVAVRRGGRRVVSWSTDATTPRRKLQFL